MEVQNLRVYERRGLLEPQRTSGGTRLYSPADIEPLHRIRDLLAEGLNLAGIARVLELEGRCVGCAPTDRWCWTARDRRSHARRGRPGRSRCSPPSRRSVTETGRARDQKAGWTLLWGPVRIPL